MCVRGAPPSSARDARQALTPCFLTFCALLDRARYTLWPSLWPAMLRHNTQSLFLGCVPMALSTIGACPLRLSPALPHPRRARTDRRPATPSTRPFLRTVDMLALAVAPSWGGRWVAFTWALWWFNVVLALLVAIGVPHQMVRLAPLPPFARL